MAAQGSVESTEAFLGREKVLMWMQDGGAQRYALGRRDDVGGPLSQLTSEELRVRSGEAFVYQGIRVSPKHRLVHMVTPSDRHFSYRSFCAQAREMARTYASQLYWGRGAGYACAESFLLYTMLFLMEEFVLCFQELS